MILALAMRVAQLGTTVYGDSWAENSCCLTAALEVRFFSNPLILPFDPSPGTLCSTGAGAAWVILLCVSCHNMLTAMRPALQTAAC
jgi:hypothetical protein